MGAPEAAAYLGVRLNTLYRRINLGEIRAYKLGRVIRLRKDDVDAYLEAHRIQPGDLDHLCPPAAQVDED